MATTATTSAAGSGREEDRRRQARDDQARPDRDAVDQAVEGDPQEGGEAEAVDLAAHLLARIHQEEPLQNDDGEKECILGNGHGRVRLFCWSLAGGIILEEMLDANVPAFFFYEVL